MMNPSLALRHTHDDVQATPQPGAVPDTVIGTPSPSGVVMTALPPLGASPAGDLQRRVCDAALRGFFAEQPKAWHYGTLRRIAIVTIAGVSGWGAVFGIGSLLFR